MEVLVRVPLFEKKLNADSLAGHLLETILLRLGLKLDYWMTTQQDRANPKKYAIKKSEHFMKMQSLQKMIVVLTP